MNWPEDKLSRFEVARLLGARTLQIALGAPILTKTENTNPENIAKEEFLQKLIPITVKRKLPSGQFSVVQIKRAIENWASERGGRI